MTPRFTPGTHSQHLAPEAGGSGSNATIPPIPWLWQDDSPPNDDANAEAERIESAQSGR